MFTGLIRHRGTVRELDRSAHPARLIVDLGADLAGKVETGDSVALDGVCLTVVSLDGTKARFDVLEETLRRSTMGDYRVDQRVNIEDPMRAGDPFGGHFVQGHVDAVGQIEEIVEHEGQWTFRFSAPASIMTTTVEKGSISIDGISLTVVSVTDDGFTTEIIPETFTRTTLGEKTAGASVNLEADVLGKYVERIVAARLPR